ncbi:MAG: putative toxin-antitoxin system toxin component, PIN family [Caldilineaceae bacterium]|nr:putative toxin-antitoxin system toxin component, PIN family [Caldilineaceae bacterium]
MRIALDTNVLVSALVAAQSAPAQILARCHSGELELVASPDSLAELRRVLHYPHIRQRLTYSDEQIEGYMAYLEQTAALLSPTLTVRAVPDDADDDLFVALALEAQAPYLISGDKHLLSVGHYAGVTILKPAAFLQLWQTLHPEPPQG